MQIHHEQLEPTKVKLTITANADELDAAKQEVLRRLGRELKLPGFRPGKAPLSIVERNTSANTLQAEVIDKVLNRLYSQALDQERIRPVAQPQVTLQKFVPYTALEFTAEFDAIGKITLPDYKHLNLAKKPADPVTEKDVDNVIRDLQRRAATKKEVDRPAKEGDEVVIDFAGQDAKSKEPVQGADGKGYPLLLGSDTFIPGFETNLIGLKPGEKKTFKLTFPADYGVSALKNRAVTFDVTVNKVHELEEPNADDEFASKAGPFKTMDEMRADIRKQLQAQKDTQADRDFQNVLIEKLAVQTKVAIPAVLIDEEVEREEQEIKRNLAYRSQTWEEYLKGEGKDEAAFREAMREPAEQRLKGSLALTEVAEQEGLKLTSQELSIRLQLLKGQYKDPAMQSELNKPESIRSISSQLMTEKTVAKLVEYADEK